MPTKTEIETYMTTIAAELGHFQAPTPELVASPQVEQLLEVGYTLLEHYEVSTDTTINDRVIGALIDAAMALHMLEGTLPADLQARCQELRGALESLVNAITAAIERNIAGGG